jgi:hypothetical protein
MRSEAEKYYAYARECFDQAGRTDSATKRDKLLELARVWTQAAWTEQSAAQMRAATVQRSYRSG